MAAAIAVLAAGAAAAGADYEQTFTLREPLGYTWTDELVRRDLAVKEKNVAAESFALFGPDGVRLPCQVEVLDGQPDAVRRLRLWFKVTLPKNEEVALRVAYNDDRRPAEAAVTGPRASVVKEKGSLVLSSGIAEMRLADTAAFREPKALADAAPILGVRPAGAGKWYGQWSDRSEARFKSRTVTVEAEGPVWAQVRIAYETDDKKHVYELTARCVAGEPCVDVLERYRLPPGSRRRVLFGGDLAPAEILWMPWFVRAGDRAEPAYDVRRVAIAEAAASGEPFATLRPKWTQAGGHAQVCLAVGSGGGPAIGILATSPGDWDRPYEQFIEVRVPAKGEGLAMDFPLVEGSRRWALLAGTADRFDSKAALQHLMRRNWDIPLQRVLCEWVLEWKRDAAKDAPHILTTLERLSALRADFAADRDIPAVRLLKRALAGEAKGEKELARLLAAGDGGAADVEANLYLERCYQDDFLSPPSYPRRLARAMEMTDLASAGRPAPGPQAALVGYVFSDGNYWPGTARGWGVGDQNFHADMYKLAIYAAARLPDHPHARRWMAFGLENLRDGLRKVVFLPGGAGYECPGSSAASLGAMLAMMQAAKNSGLEDPFRWPEGCASLEYLRNLHTPTDPRLGRRVLASIGDTRPWQDGVGVVFGMAAAGYKDADPAFASACMAMYRHYWGEEGSGDLADDLLRVDQSVPILRLEDLAWPSAAYPGFGAVLRSRFGSPKETFAAFKCGPARGGYQGDELAFHFYGAGMPLALDWFCGDEPRPDQEHMHNRVNLGQDENMDAEGRFLAFRSSEAADLAVGQVESDRLRRLPRYPHQLVPQAAYPRRALARPACYRRYLALVKHPEGSPLEDYLVVRDELAADEAATFNLFVLARSVRQEGQAFHFAGQLAADAVAFFATPEAAEVTLDRWSWPTRGEEALIPEGFRIGEDRWREGELQQHLRVGAAPGRPFLVVLYPYRRGEAVPAFESLADGRGVRVVLGKVAEEVYLATEPADGAAGQAVVRRAGRDTVLLGPTDLPPLR
ncbi:MAG TPA: hypothetical protein VMY35_11055 [Phycisphaerae bacterium]|nr:hypothetical protein [Phycisphaerae bacterium]